MRKRVILLFLLLTACSGLGEDIDATVDAGRTFYATESANLAAQSNIDQTEVAATLSAAGTTVAQLESVNRQVFATVAAGSTPTPGLVQGDARPSNTGMGDDVMSGEGGAMLFTTGIAEQVNSENGCVINASTTFSPPIDQLYATMRAFDVEAGTPLRAEWYYGDELRVTDVWNVDSYSNDRCLWFQVDSSRTEFTPGEWSVRLYFGEAGIPFDNPMPFFIREE